MPVRWVGGRKTREHPREGVRRRGEDGEAPKPAPAWVSPVKSISMNGHC